ncbi:hypothetical protein B0T24DRAFT_600228 [Lasiosphaeria ovina]|uniref:Uncharacterized protein n=1 Tax=Lasiosphaeria ovina TaxID=92902 RepID=A0AAE0JRB6_9PEZI|nr:hypothetical protein B0T24DRAFT_600228 [Lasiosphaeria ovina]
MQDQQNIFAAINALGQRIDALAQYMDHWFDTLERRFNSLENRQTNFEIAAVNARLMAANSAAILQPPVDIRNGGDIPNFPVSQPQLFEIDNAAADAILPALGIHLAPNMPLGIKRESILRKWIQK